MISCVKSWDITEYSNKLFHDIPLNTSNYQKIYNDNHVFDYIIEGIKTTAFNVISDIQCHIQVAHQNDFYLYMRITPESHILLIPIMVHGPHIIRLVMMDFKLDMKTTIDSEEWGRHHIQRVFVDQLFMKFNKWLNIELFKCACRGIDIRLHSWDKVVDFRNIS